MVFFRLKTTLKKIGFGAEPCRVWNKSWLGCAEGLCRLMLRNNDSKAALKRVTLCEYRQTIRKRGRRGQEEAGGGRDVDVVAVPTVSAFDVGVIGGGGGGRPHGGPRPRPHRPAPGPVGPGWLHQLSECSPAPPPPDSLLRPPASGGRGGGRDAADAADGLVAAVGVEVHQPPVGATAPRPPAPPSSRGPGTTELSARFQTTFK